MSDTFEETVRRALVAQNTSDVQSNDITQELTRLRELHGNEDVWDTDELRATFKVESFAAPFCFVERKADRKKGCVEFQHHPRVYFRFLPT